MQGSPGLVAATGMSGEAEKVWEQGADPNEGTEVRIRPLDWDHAECTVTITKPTWSLHTQQQFRCYKTWGALGILRYKVGIQRCWGWSWHWYHPLVLAGGAHRDTEPPLFLGVSTTAGIGISAWSRDKEKCSDRSQKCAKQAAQVAPAAAHTDLSSQQLMAAIRNRSYASVHRARHDTAPGCCNSGWMDFRILKREKNPTYLNQQNK